MITKRLILIAVIALSYSPHALKAVEKAAAVSNQAYFHVPSQYEYEFELVRWSGRGAREFYLKALVVGAGGAAIGYSLPYIGKRTNALNKSRWNPLHYIGTGHYTDKVYDRVANEWYEQESYGYLPPLVSARQIALTGLGISAIDKILSLRTRAKIDTILHDYTPYDIATMSRNEALIVWFAFKKDLYLMQEVAPLVKDFLEKEGVWQALVRFYYDKEPTPGRVHSLKERVLNPNKPA